MGSIKQKEHVTGVVIIRAEGNLTSTDIEDWRGELEDFVKASEKSGACGALVDVSDVEEFSIDALDSILEFLADPEEVIGSVRMRFALIGLKPFTQRFLREALPLEEVKHIRARFFHETAEDEALAWLQAMVSSANDLPEVKRSAGPDEGVRDKKPQPEAKVGILKFGRPVESKMGGDNTEKKAAETKISDKTSNEKKSVVVSADSKDAAKKK